MKSEETEVFKKLLAIYADVDKFKKLIDSINWDKESDFDKDVVSYLKEKKKKLEKDLEFSDFKDLEMQKEFIDFDK